MTNINVAEWSPEQVAQWLSGLEDPVPEYIPSLTAKGLNGKRLLLLRCDDLDYLGVTKIGHQELILEAVEQLRHFHYESDRECIQQLAVRVSTAARSLIRCLAKQHESKLQTQTLADVSRLIQFVKQLICWLDQWSVSGRAGWWKCGGSDLVRGCVEAATAAHRDTFADRPATTILHTARTLDHLTDYILQEVNDPVVVSPLVVWTSPPRAPLSPPRDQLLQVGGVVVIGWGVERVRRECESGPPRPCLVRGPRRPPCPADNAFRVRPIPSIKKEVPVESDSDDSGPLSPPASPTAPHLRTSSGGCSITVQRRYTVCGGSPRAARAHLGIHQFWRDLKHQKWSKMAEDDESSSSPYRRDKAMSCSTGLERPNTHLGVGVANTAPYVAPPAAPRAKLDKTQSTPPYDFRGHSPPLASQVIPESPSSPSASPSITVISAEKTDQILDFKKSSSQIQEAMMHNQPTQFTFEHPEEDNIMETVNIAVVESKDRFLRQSPFVIENLRNIQNEVTQAINEQRVKAQKSSDQPPEPPPRPQIAPKPIIREPSLPVKQDWFKDVSTFKPTKQEAPEQKEYSPLKPVKNLDASQISLPLQHITKYDLQMMHGGKTELPALNSECHMNKSQNDLPKTCKEDSQVKHSYSLQRFESTSSISMISPAANVAKMFFPNSKTKSLKKKNSLLAKGREVPVMGVWGSSSMCGEVRQRGRGAGAGWGRRYLVLHNHLLLAYRNISSRRACSSVCVSGWAAEAAGEVRSQPNCFKLYSPAHTIYFATNSAQDSQAWIQAIQRASMSEAGSEAGKWSESSGSEDEESKDKNTNTLDRAYLKIFSRSKQKEDKNKQSSPVPSGQYRSYRRAPPSSPAPSLLSPQATPLLSPQVTPLLSPQAPPLLSPLAPPLPRPLQFIHASNPNLLDFDKTDFVTKPNIHVPLPKGKLHTSNDFIGFVTLEEFMLKKQEEERRQVYTNRVLMGIERDTKEDRVSSKKAAKDLQKQLDKIIPDVIYGELPTYTDEQLPIPVLEIQNRSLPKTPDETKEKVEFKITPESKPISVKGKDGYEKIVYPDEKIEDEPPKLMPRMSISKEPELPRKPVSRQSSAKENDISRKFSITSAKDLGYEVIYDDDIKSLKLEDGKNRKSESDDKSAPPELKAKQLRKSESDDKGAPPELKAKAHTKSDSDDKSAPPELKAKAHRKSDSDDKSAPPELKAKPHRKSDSDDKSAPPELKAKAHRKSDSDVKSVPPELKAKAHRKSDSDDKSAPPELKAKAHRKSDSDDKTAPPELKAKSPIKEPVPIVPPRPPNTLERARLLQRGDSKVTTPGLKSAAQYTPLYLPPHSRTLQPHREVTSMTPSRNPSSSSEEPTPPPRPQPPRVPSYRHLDFPPVFQPETYSLQPPHTKP